MSYKLTPEEILLLTESLRGRARYLAGHYKNYSKAEELEKLRRKLLSYLQNFK